MMKESGLICTHEQSALLILQGIIWLRQDQLDSTSMKAFKRCHVQEMICFEVQNIDANFVISQLSIHHLHWPAPKLQGSRLINFDSILGLIMMGRITLLHYLTSQKLATQMLSRRPCDAVPCRTEQSSRFGHGTLCIRLLWDACQFAKLCETLAENILLFHPKFQSYSCSIAVELALWPFLIRLQICVPQHLLPLTDFHDFLHMQISASCKDRQISKKCLLKLDMNISIMTGMTLRKVFKWVQKFQEYAISAMSSGQCNTWFPLGIWHLMNGTAGRIYGLVYWATIPCIFL